MRYLIVDTGDIDNHGILVMLKDYLENELSSNITDVLRDMNDDGILVECIRKLTSIFQHLCNRPDVYKWKKGEFKDFVESNGITNRVPHRAWKVMFVEKLEGRYNSPEDLDSCGILIYDTTNTIYNIY